MILFPAIDLKGGACVRLEQGDMARATLFNKDPAAQAEKFAAQGFSHLHLVDLDGAFAGASVNGQAVADILAASKVFVQLGGGIRTMENVETWLAKGVGRVILGTAALHDPDFVKEAARAFPNQIAVGIDARNGCVAVAGWAETSTMQATALAQRFENAGVAALIYTDIERDGMLGGVNVAATQALAQATKIPVIASGGLGGLDDVRAVQKLQGDGVVGAIAGRALYDGRLDAAAALALDGVA